LRGDDETRQPTALPRDVVKFVMAEHRPTFAATAGGKRLAVASAHELYLSNDGGVSFIHVEVPGVAAACFAGDDDTAELLVVAVSSREPIAHLVRITEDGEASRLADIPGSAESTESFGDVSIAWDASRELLWIASRHGLVAWGPARRH
ncbi:MAG TPA: hypothetical protein PK156_48170, partial [Polyangium sp.]|nr:hypothetical protein [Polyangium sp.]